MIITNSSKLYKTQINHSSLLIVELCLAFGVICQLFLLKNYAIEVFVSISDLTKIIKSRVTNLRLAFDEAESFFVIELGEFPFFKSVQINQTLAKMFQVQVGKIRNFTNKIFYLVIVKLVSSLDDMLKILLIYMG